MDASFSDNEASVINRTRELLASQRGNSRNKRRIMRRYERMMEQLENAQISAKGKANG